MSDFRIKRLKGVYLDSSFDYKYRIEMDILDADAEMKAREDSWAVAKNVKSRITLGENLDLITQSNSTVLPNSSSNEVVFDSYVQNASVDEMLDIVTEADAETNKKGKIKIRVSNLVVPVNPDPPADPICRVVSLQFDKNPTEDSYSMNISLSELNNHKIKSTVITNHGNGMKVIAITLESSPGNSSDQGNLSAIELADLQNGISIVVSENPTITNLRQALVQIL